MIRKTAGEAGATIRATATMHVENPEMDMDEAVERLREAGNEIVEVHDDERDVVVLDEDLSEETVVWVCEHCEEVFGDQAVAERHEAECDNGD